MPYQKEVFALVGEVQGLVIGQRQVSLHPPSQGRIWRTIRPPACRRGWTDRADSVDSNLVDSGRGIGKAARVDFEDPRRLREVGRGYTAEKAQAKRDSPKSKEVSQFFGASATFLNATFRCVLPVIIR